ncbi:Gluconate transporter protein, partial [Pseudomonas savastanoi pv. glycinea]
MDRGARCASRTKNNNNRNREHDSPLSRCFVVPLYHHRPECTGMTPLMLMIVAGAGIALLLFLVLKYKFQPFVALMLVSIIVALVAGVKPADLVTTIEGGMGKTLGHIAIIIALGAMIGRIIELSGGAEALAKTLINRFGNKRTPLALTVAGFMVGIPVFFEVGVIILMPLAYGVARAAQ